MLIKFSFFSVVCNISVSLTLKISLSYHRSYDRISADFELIDLSIMWHCATPQSNNVYFDFLNIILWFIIYHVYIYI